MDKISEMLVKCGLTQEVASQICQTIKQHDDAVRESVNDERRKLKEEYDKRLEAAKKVCVEEVDSYKIELARRLQIFLEAKSVAIDQTMAKNTVVRESEAALKLEQIKAMLDGVVLDETAA